MFLVDQLILLGAILLLVGTVSSKLSAHLGLPVLVVFVGIGMLAGENGIGRIDFDNFVIAHAVGTLALAIILFDGGLQTRTAAIRAVWKPSLLLATVGVVITAAITGIAAAGLDSCCRNAAVATSRRRAPAEGLASRAHRPLGSRCVRRVA